MNDVSSLSADPPRISKFLLSVNLLLGGILWFGFLTDYAWANTFLNVAYPFMVGLLAFVTLVRYRPYSFWPSHLLCLLPSAIGSACHVLAVLIFVLLALPAMFWLSEVGASFSLQEVRSPGGGKTVIAQFYPVGAYARGNGHVEVFLNYDGLPFVRRHIYSVPVSYADAETRDYLRWEDDETVYVTETGETITPGWVATRKPFFVLFILRLVNLLQLN